uniref:TrbC/VirB2 family protein n=1 Tax=Carnobacterium sp. TaxID=48221 RepID=UPI003450ACCC
MNNLKMIANNMVYNDIFKNVQTTLQELTKNIQGITMSMVVLCIVITGLMFIFGEGPSRTAKKWLLYIGVGAFLVWGAATLGTSLQDVTGF